MDTLLSGLDSTHATVVGTFTNDATVSVNEYSWNIDDLRNAWLGGLQI